MKMKEIKSKEIKKKKKNDSSAIETRQTFK